MPQRPAPAAFAALEKKLVGYGLPCSRCHAYYPADMHVCPICKSPDRVSPAGPVVHSMASSVLQPAPGSQIDQKRKRLLKELTSEPFASHTHITPPSTSLSLPHHT